MNTLICAGGSGLRSLEAVLHLCAVGLGPAELRLLIIDPDGSNGNSTRTVGLLEKYQAAHEKFAGKLGPGVRLFGTRLDLFNSPGSHRGLKNWSPIQGSQKLAELLNLDGLPATGTPPDIVKLFFTREELDMELDQGFRGHPAIGAAAMALVSLHSSQQPWNQVIEQIRGDVSQPQGSRVFLIGSVFGGTGASALHPILRFLRRIPESGGDRLKIGASAIVPYFRFAASAAGENRRYAEMAAKAERFPLATRASAEYYEHLRSNGDLHFDVMYWIGDNSPVPVAYAPGGPGQKNPPHFVDFISALAAVEFFQNPEARKGLCYAGPREDAEVQLGGSTLLEWPDLPLAGAKREEVQKKLLRFFLVGFMHTGFFDALFRDERLDRRPYCVPWYFSRFAQRHDWFSQQENQETLRLLSDFFNVYHFPWWSEILRQETVRLFNRAAFSITSSSEGITTRLDRLGNLLWPDAAGAASFDQVDKFFTEMVKVPKNRGGDAGAASYLGLLADAADSYIKSEYRI